MHPPSAGVRRAIAGLRPIRNANLVHGLDVDLPLFTRATKVTTVHDLSVFDVSWAMSTRRAAGERRLVARAVRSADVVIAVSEFTAHRVAMQFGKDAVVTPLAPRSGLAPATNDELAAVQRRYELPDRFVLHIGSVDPRKDVDSLARACHHHRVPLVLAGPGGGRVPTVGDVRTLPYVPAEELAALYGLATVLGYPSRYEGFGLPPVEAMACGAAVVATAVGALPELFGGVLPLAQPNDPDSLEDVLGDVLGDEGARTELALKGREAVSRLSWESTAMATIAAYGQAGVDA